MRTFSVLTLGVTLAFVFITACNATGEDTPNPQPQSVATEPAEYPPTFGSPTTETQPTPVNTPDPTLREMVEKAKGDLSKLLNIKADQIRIMEARAIDWPDASLGCPQPEMTYATVITPGYWILLEANGKQYPYHTDKAAQVILCLGNASDPGSGTMLPVIPINPDEIMDGQPWMP